MQFVKNKVTFGRHESFALRFGWLTKGFQALEKDPDIFKSDEATIVFGVGKNMVNSIKHWLRATQLCSWHKTDGIQKTKLGEVVFGENGLDPYLEDEATIWLIHWLLVTNPTISTSWYWFFNKFHKLEFTSIEVASAISDFANDNIEGKHSKNSIKQDIAVLLRCYMQTKDNSRVPAEEALDSPLSLLKLISYSSVGKVYQSKLGLQENLPLGIFGYALNDFFIKQEITEIPIEELMYSTENIVTIGPAFRLTENALLTKLEQLVNYIPEVFKIDETAGIHQLYKLQEIDSINYLEKHYNNLQQDQVA